MEASIMIKSANVGTKLIPLAQIRGGEVCYTPRYGFKLQVIRQDEFETEVKILTAVVPGARTNYVRTNTELVTLSPIDIEEIIDESRSSIPENPKIRMVENSYSKPTVSDSYESVERAVKPKRVVKPKSEAKSEPKPEPKKRGRKPKATSEEELKAVEAFVRPAELERRGALVNVVIEVLETGSKDINQIISYMHEHRTHATKQECAAFFRSTVMSEEARAKAKGVTPRIIREGNTYKLS